LAAGIAVMILATITDEFQGCAMQTSRCAILYSPPRDGARECIWNAIGIPPGRVLEVDFGERQLTIGGQHERVYLFVAILSFSRRLYVKAFGDDSQASWFDGLESAFFNFGGAPREVLFLDPRPFFRSDQKPACTDNRLRAFPAHWSFLPRPGAFDYCFDHSRWIDFSEESAFAGRAFASWTELQGFLDRWVCEVADRQLHADGIEAPIERFERAKASALQTINGRPPFRPQSQPAKHKAAAPRPGST
jgi:hypothetical protein